VTETPFGNPDAITNGAGEPLRTVPSIDAEESIVDSILKLDEFLSGDVRRARKSAIFYTRPDLEARLDDLDEEFASLTDAQGRPRPVIDQPLDGGGDGGRSAQAVMLEREEVAAEYAASRVRVEMEQLDEDDWTAHMARHKKTLDEDAPGPYKPEFYEETIALSAVAPRMTVEQVRALRKRVGRPVYDTLFNTAWAVNTRSGVSVPKSLLSSAVLRQQPLG
jgi:hypothetical protein